MEAAAVLCAVLVGAGQVEASDQPEGLYVKLAGMGVLQEDSELRSVGGIPLNATMEFDAGFGAGGGVGWTFTFPDTPVALSLEFEYTYRTADIDLVTAPGLTLPASGTNLSSAFMLNTLVNWDIAGGFGIYGGGGFGATLTQADLLLDLGGGFTIQLPKDDDFTFSWQVMGGVQLSLGKHVVLFGGMRYFDAGDVTFDTFGGENRNLNVEAGIRVYF